MGEVQAFNHLDKGDAFPVDCTLRDADAGAYDALVIPGGVANSDFLRTVPEAVSFVRLHFAAGKPAAVIRHGLWVLVKAGLIGDWTLTSWPSLKTDIENAGGTWIDTEVQVHQAGPNTLVASRKPDDLPAFCATFTQVFWRQSQSA